MHHETLSLHTDNARTAAELAARLQSAAAEEGLSVTAEGATVTIGFANPVLAGIANAVSAVCRAIRAPAAGIMGALAGRGNSPALPGRNH